MHEAHWRAIVEKIRLLAQGQQGRLRYGDATLTVERRGDVFVALRAISPSQLAAWMEHNDLSRQPGAHTPFRQDGQLLRIAECHHLCSWRRQPTDWDWLTTLATIPL